jgi:hypothetical protein
MNEIETVLLPLAYVASFVMALLFGNLIHEFFFKE